MDMTERITVLRDSPIWAGQADDDLAAVAEAMEPRRFGQGTAVLEQGAQGSGLQIVVEGAAEARVRGESGRWVSLARFGRGDCFGEMSLLTGEGASADIIAVEALSTLELPRGSFDEMLARRPAMLRPFLRLLSERLTVTNTNVFEATERAEDLIYFLRQQDGDDSLVLVGKERANKDLDKAIAKAAASDEPYLLAGEAGVGKELAAKLIHYGSRRCTAPLMRVQCDRLSANEWGDPLFGARGSEVDRTVSYLELAAGGTLLLHHIDSLPGVLQDRLAEYLSRPAEERVVRFLATSRAEPAEEVAAGRILPRLGQLILGNVVSITPLRERKRDIPELANHFLSIHARRQGKEVQQFDDQAVIKLVSYNYAYGNVRELEEAVERAVTITDGPVITPDEVFLGAAVGARPSSRNLLDLPDRWRRLALALFPGLPRFLVAAVFLASLLLCLFGSTEGAGRYGLLLAWCLWWPGLFLSFLFVGRGWCAVCPMGYAGSMAQRWISLEKKVPAWVKGQEVPLLVAGFLLIVWIEEASGMRWHPRDTGYLLLTIGSLAVVCSMIFPRRTWCRHLCPLGGLASVCSTSAMIELRPRPDICAAKCKGHSCFKGTEAEPGCPMFQHVMFVDTNQHCVLCLNCVRSCPNGSPSLSLRFPGQELWQHETGRPEAGLFVAMLIGLLPAVALLQHWDDGGGGWLGEWVRTHRVAGVTCLMAGGVGLPMAILGGLALLRRRGWLLADPAAIYRRVMAWMPLVWAGWTAYQLRFVPMLSELRTELVYQTAGQPHLHFSLLAALSVMLLTVGLLLSTVAQWRLPVSGTAPTTIRSRLWYVVAGVAYWGGLMVLLIRPEWFVS